MRHLPEQYVQPLFRILDEYEAGLRGKPKKSLSDDIKLWHLGNIRNKLNKRV